MGPTEHGAQQFAHSSPILGLPAPEIIAWEIVEDLTAALAEFEAVAAALESAAAKQ